VQTLPNSISADGSIIVGQSTFKAGSGSYDEAFRWAAGVTTRLGAGRYSQAMDISPDGSLIVGGHVTGDDGAWFWTSETGYRPIQDWLEGMNVSGLEGWNLTSANGVSLDGQWIVGHGLHEGRTEGWALNVPRYKKFTEGMSGGPITQAVPEPATFVLAAIALLGVLIHRRYYPRGLSSTTN
jgi:hypothetical protein